MTERFKCWCGEVVTDADFSDELTSECGGLGTLYCDCGGDSLCVCHHHGEVECPGCEECEPGLGDEYGTDEGEFYGD